MVAVQNFYSLHPTGETFPTSYYLGNILSRATNACRTDVYAIPGTAGTVPSGSARDLGSPIATDTFSLGSDIGATTDYPYEVAVCLSFAADLAGLPEEVPGPDADTPGTRPRARRRGRISLGPICVSGNMASGVLRVGASQMTIWTEAAKEFLDEGAAAAGWVWAVWSRTEWELNAVKSVWVDNAYDTMRARGVKASARTTVAVGGP